MMTTKVIRAALLGVLVAASGAVVRAQSHSDKDFLAKDSQGSVAEVEMANLALSKSQNPDVRMFATRMVHDHEMLARNMTPFLKQAGLQPSTSLNTEHQRLYNKLKGFQGQQFDKEYVKAMDEDHHEDLSDYQSELNSTKDMQLKAAVQQGEHVIAEHTKMIDMLSQKMGMKPAGA